MHPIVEQAPPPDEELQDLLEFLYLMPIGVIKFRGDGSVEMLNAMASRLLMPLVDDVRFDNIYTILHLLCPDMADKVAGFTSPAGLVIDQFRIDGRVGHRNVTLSLTVSRVRDDVYMAAIKDISRLTEMLAYAFASADLLIDVDEQGIVGWAGGAFPVLLGMQPSDAIGKPMSQLVAPRDRDTLAKALMTISTRGRLPPILLRLANGRKSRCVMAGLALGGVSKRFLVTIGPQPQSNLAPEPSIKQSRAFATEVENWMCNGEKGVLTLLDFKAKTSSATLNADRLGQIRTGITRLAGDPANEDLVVGELGSGRYGLLAATETDLGRLGSALQTLVGESGNIIPVQIEEVRIALQPDSLTLTQSLQALRLALSRFGSAGVASKGLANSLVGIVEQASGQKKSLAAGISDGRFSLAYQPIVSLSDRAIHHYEALLRPVPDPKFPATNPQEFVTLAEAVGLSTQLDLAVLKRALEQLNQTDACLAVNISGASLSNPIFSRKLIDLVAGVPSKRLMIELTETAEIQDLPAAAAQIHAIRSVGIPICLDDFGAGNASFRYVRDLKVDFVKIDGAYVRNACQNEQSKAIISAMRDLAYSAGAQIIAEMI